MKKAASIMITALLAATLLTACSDSNPANPAAAGTSASALVISANGGEGTVGYSGGGGSFDVLGYDTTNIKVTRSGSVNTSVDFSTMEAALSSHTFDFGAESFIVATNTMIKTYETGTEAGVIEGEYHMHNDGSNVISRMVGSTDVTVTGLHVMPGVTLTLSLNVMGSTGLHNAQVNLNNDILNDGTITTVDLLSGAAPLATELIYTADGTSLDKGGLSIYASGFALNNGTITTKGTDTTASTGGGTAGWINIVSVNATVNRGTINASGGTGGGHGGSSIDLYSSGVVINSGTAIASGGSGETGGNAGNVHIYGNSGSINTGPITATGGTGDTYGGGSGGRFEMDVYNYLSPIFNSGTVMVSGGSGASGGGHGGAVGFYTNTDNYYAGGDIVNTGNLIANGGDATVNGTGGNGAYSSSPRTGTLGFEFAAYGANIRNTGTIEMKGGKGMGVGYSGGNGGALTVKTDGAYEPINSNSVVSGNVQWTGIILADGGTGEYGGGGGSIAFGNSSNVGGPYGGTIELIGYSNINLKGGKGADYGGNGGYAKLWFEPYNSGTPGTIYNDVDFDISGGEGMTTSGGNGGYFIAQNSIDWLNNNEKPGAKTDISSATVGIENYGNINTKGGQGKLNGGSATAGYNESIGMFSDRSIINTGTLNASGGLATSTDDSAGYGGNGQRVELYATGNVSNTGSIVTSGGNGNYVGGSAGLVELYSQYGINNNTGAITANGGNATASLTGSYGGAGADIGIYTLYGPIIATNTGTLTANKGTGESAGSDGIITIDWD